MDLVAEMLLLHLKERHSDQISVTQIRPEFVPRLSNWQPTGKQWFATSADRFLNRFWDYPRLLRDCTSEFDIFHIIDHSYGHLALEVPEDRTVVTCHDIDAFRALSCVGEERRSLLYRMMAKRSLNGLRRAAVVTCDSEWTHSQVVHYDLLPSRQLVVIPNGVDPACRPEADPICDAEAESLLGQQRADRVEIVHVGSTRPRKRIEFLLHIFSTVLRRVPSLHLIRIGGDFTVEQKRLVRVLGLENSITVLPFVSKKVMAAVYRRANLALLTSEREGFGLPLIEALACGAPVVATDLSVFRELGGAMATYCSLEDQESWSRSVVELIEEKSKAPECWAARRRGGIERAALFSWAAYAESMVSIYERLATSSRQMN